MINFFNSHRQSTWWGRGVGQRKPKGKTSADGATHCMPDPGLTHLQLICAMLMTKHQGSSAGCMCPTGRHVGSEKLCDPPNLAADKWVWVHTFGFNSKAQVRPQCILMRTGALTNACICYTYLQLITWTTLLPPLYLPPPTHKSPNNEPSVCRWRHTTVDLSSAFPSPLLSCSTRAWKLWSYT